MKKLICIFVLGLLLSGCASQETKQNGKIYSSLVVVELVKKGWDPVFRAYGHSRKEAIQKALAMCEVKRKEIGKGTCRVSWNCNSRGYECASGARDYKKPLTSAQKKEIKNKITLDKIKSICVGFGYKEGTEKYADCLKDLYISRELAKELKRQRRMEASEDLDRISKDLLGGKSIGESVGGVSRRSSSKDVCFFDSERKSGLNKICYYKCVSGMKTKNVGASQMCPTNY
mgnify:CR=1 FL=1